MFEVSPAVMMQINNLSADKQSQFAMHFSGVKKDGSTAMICALFGVSLIYFGEIGKFVLYLLTCGGAFIWAILLLVNAKKMAIQYNDKKAMEVLMMLK